MQAAKTQIARLKDNLALKKSQLSAMSQQTLKALNNDAKYKALQTKVNDLSRQAAIAKKAQ